MLSLRLQARQLLIAFAVVLVATWSLWVTIRSYLIELNQAPSDYKLADWLINFEAGPIRRGLLGHALTSLPDATAITTATVGLQITLYVVIFGSALVLFLQSSMNWPWIVLTLSPAFLLFPYLQIAGSFRKEIFGLAALALVAVAVRNRSASPVIMWLVPLSAAMLVLAVFSHEVNVLAVPVWVALLHRYLGGRAWVKWLLRIALTGVSLALLFALLFPGSAKQRVEICRNLTDAGFSEGICYGSIAYIGSSWTTELDRVLASWPMYIGYGAILALALLPLLQVRVLMVLWPASVATAFVAIPFLMLGLDYGRWVAFAASVLSFAALSMSPELNRTLVRLPWFVYVIYIISWSPTYFGPPFPTESLITKFLGS